MNELETDMNNAMNFKDTVQICSNNLLRQWRLFSVVENVENIKNASLKMC